MTPFWSTVSLDLAPDDHAAGLEVERHLARSAQVGHVDGFWTVLRVHMIEEYARHNGHADLIRESIDGRTGE